MGSNGRRNEAVGGRTRENDGEREREWERAKGEDKEWGLELIIGKIETSGALAAKVYCGMESHFAVSIKGRRKNGVCPHVYTHTAIIYT